MTTRHPVVLYKLDPSDDGYSRGARFRLDTVDGTQFFFRSEPGARGFSDEHGMKIVKEEEMTKLREALK